MYAQARGLHLTLHSLNTHPVIPDQLARALRRPRGSEHCRPSKIKEQKNSNLCNDHAFTILLFHKEYCLSSRMILAFNSAAFFFSFVMSEFRYWPRLAPERFLTVLSP